LTTPDQLRVRVSTGEKIDLSFGAAQGVEPVAPPPADNAVPLSNVEETALTPDADPMADNLGLIVFGVAGVVLVAGLGLSVFLRRR
jgi:hypothetical protein